MRARLERGAAFVTQLHRLSTKSPNHLEQAISDAEMADLIERRADDQGLIILTAEGRAAASQ